jgi:hypothetical protein
MPPVLKNLLPLFVLVLVWLLIVRPLSHRWERQAKERRGAQTRDARQRTATKREVIWRIGVLYWGGMMFVFFAVVDPMIPHFTMGKPLDFDEYIKGAIAALIAFPAGGVFGWLLWRHAERNRRAG